MSVQLKEETAVEDWAELRRLAEAAVTPGPWLQGDRQAVRWVYPSDDGLVSRTPAITGPALEPDAAYIAAANPSTVLRLLAERDRLREALEGMVYQFGYWTNGVGGIRTGGLSALEDAFDVLGWADPRPVPEMRCDEPGCMEQISTGWPTRPGGTGPNGGYRSTCHGHWCVNNPGQCRSHPALEAPETVER